jgi:cysteine desulfurase
VEAARPGTAKLRVLGRRGAPSPNTTMSGAMARSRPSSASRLPNTLSFAVPGLAASTALIALDLAGLSVSSGSACASGKVARSPVLAAMGVSPALAAGALRVSFGWNSRPEDLERFAAGFERVVSSLYQRRGQAA